MKATQTKSRLYENSLKRILLEKGYSIIKEEKNGGFRSRPDFIVKHDGLIDIIELKVSNIITDRSIFQILYYLEKSSHAINGAYLALPKECVINKKIKDKLLNSGVGLIFFDGEGYFEKIEATQKDTVKREYNYVQYAQEEDRTKIISLQNKRLEQIYENLIIYVIIGGLLVSSLISLINTIFESNHINRWLLMIYGLIFISSLSYVVFYLTKEYYESKSKNK